MKSTLFSVFSGKSGGFPRGRASQWEISVSGGLFLGGRWSGESAASWGPPTAAHAPARAGPAPPATPPRPAPRRTPPRTPPPTPLLTPAGIADADAASRAGPAAARPPAGTPGPGSTPGTSRTPAPTPPQQGVGPAVAAVEEAPLRRQGAPLVAGPQAGVVAQSRRSPRRRAARTASRSGRYPTRFIGVPRRYAVADAPCSCAAAYLQMSGSAP